jgi:hypothetical protein
MVAGDRQVLLISDDTQRAVASQRTTQTPIGTRRNPQGEHSQQPRRTIE